MKQLIILGLCLSNFIYISAQNWNHSYHFESSLLSNISQSVIDPETNDIYVTGTFNSDIFYNNDTLTSNFIDIFIAKLDSNLKIAWVKKITGPKVQAKPTIVYNNNNLYIAGAFNDSTSFSSTDGLANQGHFDAFIANYDSDGNFKWVTSIGHSNYYEAPYYIEKDQDNNLLCLIEYQDTLSINDTIYETYNSGIKNNAIVKVKPDGSINKVKNYPSSNSSRFEAIKSIEGKYYVSGQFSGKLFLNQDSIYSSSQDLFVFKTNSNFENIEWIRRSYGDGASGAGTFTYDEYNNIYLSGYFESDTLFLDTNTNDANIKTYIVNNGLSDIFLIKLNESGHLQWINNYGEDGEDRGRSIVVQDNFIYITGHFGKQLVFGDDSLYSSNSTDYNFYFGLINSNGDELGAIPLTKSGTGNESGKFISTTQEGFIYVSGTFSSDTIALDDSTYIKPSGSNFNSFVARYDPSLSATFTEQQDISCFGAQDGALTAEAYFGIPPYHYEWNTGDTTNRIFDLPPDNYTVTITDALENTVVRNISLTEPDEIIIDTVAVSDLDCYDDHDGAISIDVSGGAGDFSYTWDGPGSGIVSYAQDQSGLGSGVFTVTVTDQNECTNTASFTIDAPEPIQLINTLVTPVDPPGSSNGAIDITPTGGQGDTTQWTYDWDAQSPLTFTASTQDIENLDGGVYDLTLTDSTGCTYDTSFVVNDSAILIAYVDGLQHVTCKGDSNGYASLAILNDEGTLQYKWENNNGDSIANTPSVNDLAAGKYYITVADQTLDDSAYASLTILEAGSSLKIDQVQTIDIDCFGDGDGLIEIQASGGQKPYSYNWSNGSSTEDLTGMDEGTFYLTLTGDYGCQLDTFASINEPSAITLTDTI
ncbi:MAG: SprB repeat-containing protein, partial [Bacteroidota bacterium]